MSSDTDTDDSLEGFKGFCDDNGKSEEYFRCFNRAAKVFRGFEDDDGRSARYVRKFERMKEDLMNPVMVLKRLPSWVFRDERSSRGICCSDYVTVEPNAAIKKRQDVAVVLSERTLRSGKRIPAIGFNEASDAEARRCLNFSAERGEVQATPVVSALVETSRHKSPVSLNDCYIGEPVCVVKSLESQRSRSVKLKSLPNAQRMTEPDDSVKQPIVFDQQKTEAPQKLVEIDLSHGLTLRSFCQLKSIDIDDSDDERRAEIIDISSDDEPDPSLLDKELEAVPENPIPAGIEALTELGFLDNESFQFGKDPKAANIWSDVLNFGELDDPCVEKPIEVHASKVKISRGFDSCWETVDGKDSSVFKSVLSDNELLISDRLNCNDLDLNVNSVNRFDSSDFLNSLIRPEKLKKTLKNAEESDSHDKMIIAKKRRTNKVDDEWKEGPKITSSISLQQSKRPVNYGTLQTYQQLREIEYHKKTQWMTQKDKTNVTSAELYRNLSAIPYIIKCNIQNRSRRCHNLHPCANANKEFKLYFTTTVGGGRKVSQSLLNAIRTEDTIIDKTSAYIAASAVLSKPTTVLVPAEPETVRKMLPTQHANLLMRLFNETEEIRKREKKSVSDMAIAEMLKFKRSLMEMKSTSLDLPRSLSPKRSTKKKIKPSTLPCLNISPQKPIKPLTPPRLNMSSQKLVKSTQPSSPQLYKTNQIIAVNTKTDNKFQFIKNSMVSLIRDNELPHLNVKSVLKKRPNGSEAQFAAPPLKKVHIGSAGHAANGRAPQSSSCVVVNEDPGSSGEVAEGLGPLNKASPDVVQEIECVDLTQEDDTLPEWSAVCPALPKLGFVCVQKKLDKLLLSDKLIVPQPVEFDSICAMGVYLNSRIVNPPKNLIRSNLSRQWVLVSSEFVNRCNISPTSAQFWVSSRRPLSKRPGSEISHKPDSKSLSLINSKQAVLQSSTIRNIPYRQRSTVPVVAKPPGKFVQPTASTSTTCVVTRTTTSLPSKTCLVPYRPSSAHSVPVIKKSLQVAAIPRSSAATSYMVVPSIRCPATRQPIRPPASSKLRAITYGPPPAASLPRKSPTTGLPLVLSKTSTRMSHTIPIRSPIGQIVDRHVSSSPVVLSTAPTVNTQLPRNRPILIVRNSLPNTASSLSKILSSHAPKTK